MEKGLTEFYTVKKTCSNERRPDSRCKDCTKEKNRQYREADPERWREMCRRSEKRPERRRQQLEKAKSPEMQAKHKDWSKNNTDKLRGYCHKRRAKKEELINDFTEEQWRYALDFFGHCCAYCGKDEETNKAEYGWNIEREHVVPLTKGGGYTATNIIPACRRCNIGKFNGDFEEWYPKQEFYSEDRYEKIIAYFVDVFITKYERQEDDPKRVFFNAEKEVI